MSDYYLGTMCGTSLDAFDVSVLKITKTNFKVIGFKSFKINDDLRENLRNQISKMITFYVIPNNWIRYP